MIIRSLGLRVTRYEGSSSLSKGVAIIFHGDCLPA